MLAQLETRLPRGDHWAYEPKMDGFRGQLWRREGTVAKLLSRSGRNLAPWLPRAHQGCQRSYRAKLTGLCGAHLRTAFLKPKGTQGPFIELLQYLAPEGTPVDTTPCNVRSAHVCFFVDNLEATYRDVSERGVRFTSRPVRIAAGVHPGAVAVYGRDPDGITLKFFQR